MRLFGRLYISPFSDCFANPNGPGCGKFQAVQDGADDGVARLTAEGYDDPLGTLFVVQFLADGEEEQALNLKNAPSLVLFDQDSERAVGSLQGARITQRAVSNLVYQLGKLEIAGSGEGYVTEGGETVDPIEFFDLDGGGGFSLGLPLGEALGGCPAWMPDAVCKARSWVAALLLLALLLLILWAFKIFR